MCFFLNHPLPRITEKMVSRISDCMTFAKRVPLSMSVIENKCFKELCFVYFLICFIELKEKYPFSNCMAMESFQVNSIFQPSNLN